MFANWCSDYIKAHQNTDCYDLLRSISLLSNIERRNIMVSLMQYEGAISKVVSFDRVINMYWGSDGYLKEVIYYKNRLVICRQHWQESGELFDKAYSENDNQIVHWRRWFITGQLHEKGDYKNGYRIGYWQRWCNTGQLLSEGNYTDDKPVGYWRFWYPSGQRLAEGNYENGIPVGHWQHWNEDGT